MDAYTDKSLYPDYGKPIIEHYKPLYNSVFVAFLPFFQIGNTFTNESSQKSQQITLEEARAKDKLFNKIEAIGAEIFSYDNPSYPCDQEILENGTVIPWKAIAKKVSFESFSEINKALRTSIGGYRKAFERKDLAQRLQVLVKSENIWMPTEGSYDALTKVSIYEAFKKLNKSEIIVQDEFYEITRELDLKVLTKSEFVSEIGGKDYYIYSKDKSVLLSIEWDSFFYLICSNDDLLREMLLNSSVEGFYCTNSTTHSWEFLEGEMERLIANES